MERFVKFSILMLLPVILFIAAASYLSKDYLIDQAERFVIHKLEQALHANIKASSVSYIPGQGILLEKAAIYTQKPEEPIMFVKKILLTIDIQRLIKNKQFLATIYIEGMKKGPVEGYGRITLESPKAGGILNIFRNCVVETARVSDLTLSVGDETVSNASGDIYFKKNSVIAPDIRFLFNNEPHILSSALDNLNKIPSLRLTVRGKKMHANIAVVRSPDMVNISRCELQLLTSHVELAGQITNLNDPALLIYGEAGIAPSDIRRLIKRFAAGGKPPYKYLHYFDGYTHSKFYFRGKPGDIRTWDLSLKSRAKEILAGPFHIPDVSSDMTMARGILAVESFSARPYGGIVTGGGKLDLAEKTLPYDLHISARKININEVIRDSSFKFKTLSGDLNAGILLEGNGPDRNKIHGAGRIEVMNGNLGPMPVLSPYLGNLYGFMRVAIKEIAPAVISGGSMDFTVKDTKIATDNLVLVGNMLNVYAKGYVDFDTNLNLQAENELKESDGNESWSRGLVEFVASFGRSISTAYLTGTLSKPVWRFEYFNGPKDSLSGKIETTLKGILK